MLCFALVRATAYPGDLLRGGAVASSASNRTAPPAGTALPAAISAMTVSTQDRLARTTQALAAVRAMQNAARAAATAASAANSLRPNLPTVPINSFGQPNGLLVAAGVPKNLANPGPDEDATLWQGAKLPVATTQTSGGVTTSTVTVEQTQQQAVLNWQSFSIGRNTTLAFDQSAGGDNAGQWIAFNKIGVTGAPSQILGAITAQGQVYVINPNGIIFGGSSQVNAHALVASSLPINGNLIARGLLNNPDTQFLFSALPVAAGNVGPTAGFTPTVTDTFAATDATAAHTLALNVAAGSAAVVRAVMPGSAPAHLDPANDYTVGAPDPVTGRTTVSFTPSGLAKIAGATVTVTYTPLGDQYGNVEVQPGAQLTAPTNADHVGGRIALIGPNVTNAGTISTEDGQAILAAGLQVGFDAHPVSDPTLRGLDVYVGAAADPSSPVASSAGTATNDRIVNADGSVATGLIDAPRGNVTMTGKTVNQLGFINSSTSVAYNGRIDLLADYDAVGNALAFNDPGNPPTTTPPFVPLSTGIVTLGPASVTQIVPELSSTDRVVGTQLALPSLVNIRGASVHLAADVDKLTGAPVADTGALLFAPGAAPATDASGAVISRSNLREQLKAGVTVNAGDWVLTAESTSKQLDLFANNQGQIYLDAGAAIDVSGSQDVTASVSENIVSVQLRGTELANSPLQRDGPLRGQTVRVDITKTGTYNGQAWEGTPLADTSGYVNLVQRSVGELTTNGGTVALNAGESVVMQPGSAIDVSGGWINYQGGQVQTTQLLSGGHVYDISQATPDRVYDGIYTGTASATDPKWGTTQTAVSPLAPGTQTVPGYTQGGSGGAIAITAPAMALDGDLTGSTVAGALQRTPAAKIAATFAGSAYLPTAQAILAVPKPGELDLAFQGDAPGTLTPVAPTPPNIVFQFGSSLATASPAAPFAIDPMTGLPVPLRAERARRGAELDLSPDLLGANGFGILAVDNSGGGAGTGLSNPGGTITVPAGVDLAAAPGGAITLRAANLDIEGGVSAPGGTLNFSVFDVSPLTAITTQVTTPDRTRGNFTLGSDAVVSAAGLVVDDRPVAAAPLSQPLATDGGSVTISAYSADFLAGASIDTSGGVAISPAGKLTWGKGGALAINAGQDPLTTTLLGGRLLLDAGPDPDQTHLIGYAGAGAKGASLSITAPLVQVGGAALANGDTAASGATFWVNPVGADGGLLGPDFFSQGGFASYALTGIGAPVLDQSGAVIALDSRPALTIAGGVTDPVTGHLIPTVIAPVASNWVTAPDPAGGPGLVLVPLATPLPAGQRTPVSLVFTAKGTGVNPSYGTLLRGDLVMGAGAIIRTDPQTDASRGVSFKGDTVTILGSVTAPGGTIAISASSGSRDSNPIFGSALTEALPTVDLGPAAVLSTAGATVITPDPRGFRTGSVLPGGTITVQGNIVAEAGATLDVSGWSDSKDAAGLLYFPASRASADTTASGSINGSTIVPIVVDSNGGTIALTGRQELYTDATLLGAAGGPSAQGGSLSISSGRFYLEGSQQSASDVMLTVTQSGPTIPKTYRATGTAVIGNPVNPLGVDADGNPAAEGGHFAADGFATRTVRRTDGTSAIAQGGFDSIALGGMLGAVEFQGSVSLAANRSLTTGSGGTIVITPTAADPDPTVTLAAPYVALGFPFQPPTVQASAAPAGSPPDFGSGMLSVSATRLIDLGNLSLPQVGTATFNAQAGDIRGDGTLSATGSITLDAGQVYPPTASVFTVVAYDHEAPDGTLVPGSITIGGPVGATLPPVPLSAGGQLNLLASTITQGGVLRAPIGTINLGSTDASLAGVPVTGQLTLLPGSVTSVSAVDPVTGTGATIPYGISLNGTQWIAPTGADITVGGVPGKSINLAAAQIADRSGSVVDVSGGGDLYAYRFVPGVGGTNDVLAPGYLSNPSSPTQVSFAVVAGYAADYAPYGAYSITNVGNLGSDPGYIGGPGGSWKVGDRVYLGASAGLPAGIYTVLPARYALLTGGFLVTPKSGTPAGGTVALPDGSNMVAGYRFNDLVPLPTGTTPLLGAFEVAPGSVVRARAQYDDFSANDFFTKSAQAAGAAVPRLPVDAGQVLLAATQSMSLLGQVNAQPLAKSDGTPLGLGGLVDIASPQDILIAGPTADVSAAAGDLVLDAADLSRFGAASLLVGGRRTTGPDGTTVTVTADNLTVDNAGAPLTGPDVILAANGALTVAKGAQISQSGSGGSTDGSLHVIDQVQLRSLGDSITLSGTGAPVSVPAGTPGTTVLSSTIAGTITLPDGTTSRFAASDADHPNPFSVPAGSTLTLDGRGTISLAGSEDTTVRPVSLVYGDGALLRVSSDPAARVQRSGLAGSVAPNVTIAANAAIAGASVVVDSTYGARIDPTVNWTGSGAVAFDSGQISIQLEGAGPLRAQADGQPTPGLVLSAAALQSLQKSATALSLLSYSSIDIYGNGTIGSPGFASIALHAPEIFGDGGTATFAAEDVLLDNTTGLAGPDAAGAVPAGGTLVFNTATIRLGAGQLAVGGYAATRINATSQVLLQGTGTLAAGGDLGLTTPLVAAQAPGAAAGSTPTAGAIDETIAAAGSLQVLAPGAGAPSTTTGDLGARLNLVGQNVDLGTRVSLPSGALTLHATGGADAGDITLESTADLSLGGIARTFYDVTKYTDGGSVSLTADHGLVNVAQGATIDVSAQAGGGDAGSISVSAPEGSFALDAGAHLLGQGGRGGSFAIDVSSIPGDVAGTSSLAALGDTLAGGGFLRAAAIRVRTGDVAVDGTIKAGTVRVAADAGSIDVTGDGVIDASGSIGGTVELAASGSVTLEPDSSISVRARDYDDAGKGGSVTLAAGSSIGGLATAGALGTGPQLNLMTGSTVDLSVVNNRALQLNTSGISSIALPAGVAVTLPTGTPGNDEVTFGSAGTLTTPDGRATPFVAGFTTAVAPRSVVTLASAGTIAFAAGGTGGAVPVNLPADADVMLTGVADLTAVNATGTLHLRAPQAVDAGGAPVDVQIGTIGGQITGASNIVVEGFRTYVPPTGVVDTVKAAIQDNGAAFAGGLDSTGTLQPGHTAAIASRLLAGNADQEALAAVLHLQPGVEVVNPADPGAATPLTLNGAGSTLALPAATSIAFPGGGTGLQFSVGGVIAGAAGTITSPDGTTTTAFTADDAPVFAAGSTVTLSGAGAVTLAGAGTLSLAPSAGPVPVNLPAGGSYAVNGAGGATFAAGAGTGVVLTNSGPAGSALTVPAGAPVAFVNGTPGGGAIVASQSGRVVAPNGSVTVFAANARLNVTPGSTVTLDAGGTIRFAAGTTPLQLALSAGSYTTAGTATLAATAGDLTLAASWDLSTYRFGPDAGRTDPMSGLPVAGSGEPGVLALRAAGNLVFPVGASLSDGFDPTKAVSAVYPLWMAPLLPAGTRSWSYTLVAGADLGAAAPDAVQPLGGTAGLPAGRGSVLLGAGATALPVAFGTTTRQQIVPAFYQTIRTGTGDIAVAAARDVRVLNPLATIYTAGTQAPSLDGFDNPVVGGSQSPRAPAPQPPYYPAQFSFGGGNLSIAAGNDIGHFLQNGAGLAADSSRELPDNWLYRRGSLDASGLFGVAVTKDVASTTWWIDFSNFFEGVGALGGGNVSLTAGRDIANIDAAVPTNARMAGRDDSGSILSPGASTLFELGGGDLTVQAGRNLDAGVYYVERGSGSLAAGGSVITNATRAAVDQSVLTTLAGLQASPDPTLELPTTLFLGQGSFTVAAGGDLLLGPVANAFLLPQGTDNGYYDKSYFSTYSLTDAVDVVSLTGTVRLADSPDGSGASLARWLFNVPGNESAAAISVYQPWLKLVETDVTAFTGVSSLMPGTLRAVAFSADIDLVGSLTLSPSPQGTVDLAAAGAVNGVQPNSLMSSATPFDAAANPRVWESSVVNLSDADPARIPGSASPLGLATLTKGQQGPTQPGLFASVDALFAESGATLGENVVLQTQLALHGPAPGSLGAVPPPLHTGDAQPVRLYALGGDISGLTLFSGKAARVVAGNDITDVALYIQNVAPADTSVVAAGRDIIAYDPNSALRLAAQTPGNLLQFDPNSLLPGSGSPTAGDLQVSGPGTLEVLAGRNLNLGSGSPTQPDGTAAGITSIGNARNPRLPFAGADIVTAAGIGPSSGLATSGLDFASFVDQFVNPASAGANASRYLPDLGRLLGLDPGAVSNDEIWAEFEALPDQTAAEKEAKDRLVLDLFTLVLRDTGRARNDSQSANFGNYNSGYEAIAALFNRGLNYADGVGTGFVDQFLNPATAGDQATRYLPVLANLMGSTGGSAPDAWTHYGQLPPDQQHALALQVFAQVLADTAQAQNSPATAAGGDATLNRALTALFTNQLWTGDITLAAHEIKTSNGGDILVFAPGGQVTVGLATDRQKPDQGILTAHGGNIAIFAHDSVNVGTSRIFTLRGGNEIIWATLGNIAAGSGSKTVHAAPPTRVLIDPQSGDVQNDLAGLATGSGIGVLATLKGAPPGDVDLIAPVGTIDAGDAGIRASGNLNVAARVVLNATNIQVGGVSAGTPPPPAPPNLAPLTTASSTTAAVTSAATDVARQETAATTQTVEIPSIITVEVLGYGGGDDDSGGSDTPSDGGSGQTP